MEKTYAGVEQLKRETHPYGIKVKHNKTAVVLLPLKKYVKSRGGWFHQPGEKRWSEENLYYTIEGREVIE